MRKNGIFKLISLCLVLSVSLLSLPAQGWAMFIPSISQSSGRSADMAAIQRALESSVIKQRIIEYGLSPEEALERISRLSDEQIHQFASNLESLQAGADGVDALIFIVLVAILVVVILEATGHKVIVR